MRDHSKTTAYKLVILLGHHYCTCFSLVCTCTCTCITIMSGGRGSEWREGDFVPMHALIINNCGSRVISCWFFLMECGLWWLLHIGHMAHPFSRHAYMHVHVHVHIGCVAHWSYMYMYTWVLLRDWQLDSAMESGRQTCVATQPTPKMSSETKNQLITSCMHEWGACYCSKSALYTATKDLSSCLH